MKAKTVRLYINVRSTETDDPQKIAFKMDGLVESALKNPKYKDLRMGSFFFKKKPELKPKTPYVERKIVMPPTRLKIGQIITTGKERWEVISISEKNGIIKVLSTDDNGPFESYLDIGKKYELFRHDDDLEEIWEIEPKQMKRQTSQVLLFWFYEDEEPSIDLDS